MKEIKIKKIILNRVPEEVEDFVRLQPWVNEEYNGFIQSCTEVEEIWLRKGRKEKVKEINASIQSPKEPLLMTLARKTSNNWSQQYAK